MTLQMKVKLKSSNINLLPDNDVAKTLLKESCFIFSIIIYYPLLFSKFIDWFIEINIYPGVSTLAELVLNGALTQTKQGH